MFVSVIVLNVSHQQTEFCTNITYLTDTTRSETAYMYESGQQKSCSMEQR